MKHIKARICALLALVFLTSCASSAQRNEMSESSHSHSTAVKTAQTDQPVNLFEDRVATPKIVEETVGNIRFKVAFDRDEYYLGDDIDIAVEAENISGENITVRYDWAYSMDHAIYAAIYADGVAVNRQFMLMPPYRTDEYQELTWSAGKILTNVGRYSTSLEHDKLKNAENVSIVIYFGTEQSRLEIPITLHTEIPDIPELEPYLQNGMISDALYRRACVTAPDEAIPVVITSEARDTWNTEIFCPDATLQPSTVRYLGSTCVLLTQKQLSTYLERHTPPSDGDAKPLVYYSEDSIMSFQYEQFLPIRAFLT